MNGVYRLEIFDNRLKYDLEIRRNLTLIKGDSGSGKTNLCNMIKESESFGTLVTVKCSVGVHVVDKAMIDNEFTTLKHNCIYIIDDDMVQYARTKRCLAKILNKDNYFILMTRDDLKELPYSIHEIYCLKSDSTITQTGVYTTNTITNIYNDNETK